MHVELPELHRCCCCLPLRRGLLFWVYLKLIFGCLAITYYTFALISVFPTGRVYQCVIAIIGLMIFVIDIAFCILFITSAHRKKYEHMKIYYRYAFIMLIIGAIALLGFIGFEIFVAYVNMPYTIFIVHYMVSFTSFLFVNLVLHAYLVLLVRSEALKLEKSAQFEFTNHTSEPVCKVQIAT